ncbi:MAG: hypothetical protein FD143_2044 [Ignavibacteria bacterium]|nr:MAG: hypothetical protein FD143_2044 [Ignavibacteria bacterium]KAF0159102.1 MAG: hypothetical protein FD188_2265 [Ignavibacteria bacterium]
MNKIATDVVASLKKKPSPDGSSGSFWDFMKEQLYSDSTWDQSDLKIIETEIGARLDKLDKNEVTDLWRGTNVGMDKLDDGKKVDSSEMKEDITGDILGQVMDRMDDNYSGGSYYQSSGAYYTTEVDSVKKGKNSDEDDVEEKELTDLSEDDLNFEDEEVLGEEDFKDDDEENN